MDENEILMNRAKAVIPGGVNSPVRAFKAVGGTPRFVTRAQGAYFWDANGQRYIDYIGSWGPMILGHGHPAVLEAVQKAVTDGLSFGAPTEREIELAQEIIQLMPSIEMVRLVSSGTEAAMSAIRLARGATARAKIIKFEGCYHGHADALLVKAGSGLATLGTATSAGVPLPVIQDTVVLPYNDVPALEAVFDQMGTEIACIILEPIAGNMNFVRASTAFATRCRELCSRYGAVLIFDEVMTGFRVALGGAQAVLGIEPDLTVLGKVIGGGMPLAAFGGKRSLMEQMAPVGPVYQAGTLSGNPVATACGLATLRQIQQPGFYAALAQKATVLLQGWQTTAQRQGQAFSFDLEGGMFGFFLLTELPKNYHSVLNTNAQTFNRLFHQLLHKGVYVAPALYEAGFVSAAHNAEDIEQSVQALSEVFSD